ncbi:MAG: GNAT family N-acetyltransferase [Oscillospiraceae bacterium]|nr:GNAT family N-acetyltransferase [Oscillospiraceae bacterium]
MKYADYFKGIPLLETPRISLRAFTRDDIQPYEAIIGDPCVRRYLGNGVEPFKDQMAAERWLGNINGRLLKAKRVFTWCVTYKPEQSAIGRIDLGGFEYRTVGEISYHLARDYWGRGLATEAVGAVLAFGTQKLKLHRIEAMVLPGNKASLVVLYKNGFEEEGLLRRHRFGREFHDAVMLSVIKEENLGASK